MSARHHPPDIRRIEPLAGDWRTVEWRGASFDSARRRLTPEVEGVIRTGRHVLLVTLTGSAEHLEVRGDCGHRYDGRDRAGAVSFVPAGVTRHLRMRGVASRWGSLSFAPTLVEEMTGTPPSLSAFSNRDDPFVAASVGALAHASDRGVLDPLYGEAVGLAVLRHLLVRHWGADPTPTPLVRTLSDRTLVLVRDHVEAHLSGPLAIADLAAVAGLSVGYFQRAFRQTTGETPLRFIQRLRVEHAATRLQGPGVSITEAALESGFCDSGHFARVFRSVKGLSPREYRRLLD